MSKVSKPLVIVGSAVLAMTTLVSAAEAKKHHGATATITATSTSPRSTPRPTGWCASRWCEEKIVVIRYADGSGRVYDLASKVWHDGQNNCWSGKLPWTFKNGAWFYGNFRWSEADGTWRTNAPEQPKSVACETVPAFAGKVTPTVGQANGQKQFAGEPKTAPKIVVPPVKAAEKAPAGESAQLALPADGNAVRPSECKKYFPSVGEMLPVPCTNDRSSL